MAAVAPLGIVPSITTRTLRILSPDRIAIIKDGELNDDMSPEEMIAIARAMIGVANKAMEARPRVAEKLALDSAILLRAGVPVGLSNDRRILDMARVEAEHNRDLRRYMPGGIKSTEQVGTPAVRTHEPQGKAKP